MKNILLVTELYPVPKGENMASSVCHFFTREWVKEGYNVKVIHFQPVHCRLWYWIVRHFRSYLRNKLGGLFYSHPIKATQHYEHEGVDIFRVPIYQFIPKGRFPQKSLNKFKKEVIRLLAKTDFRPDMIVGHMLTPEVIPMLNEYFNTKTAMVAHGWYPKVKMRFPNYQKLMDSYNGWGFRSENIQRCYEEIYGKRSKSFICYSGIPAKMVAPEFKRNCESANKIVYVGELIARKFPVELLESIHLALKDSDYSVTFIGDGPERVRLEAYIATNNLHDKVKLLGRIPREQIAQELDKADVFAMISRGEAFGLVYLEAMARGCIAIASKNEGIDGVIKNDENGFLVKAGDVEETAHLIKSIVSMSSAERKLIAQKGYETAAHMTDHNMAMDYLHKLEKL